MDLTKQYKKYTVLKQELMQSYNTQVANVFSDKSHLWQDILDKREMDIAFPSYGSLLSMQDERMLGGVAALPMDKMKTKLFYKYYNDLLSPSEMNIAPEHLIGMPYLEPLHGTPISKSDLQNLRLFHFIKELLPEAFLARKLDIVEIGAGYGGLAYMLVKSGLVRSYTIIDLQENLQLNSFYISQNFPEMAVKVLHSNETLAVLKENSLNFALPGHISVLDNLQFDLGLNSDSLGEMPKDTAKAYVSWIYEHLKEGGLFFSKNGHARSQNTVLRQSDYGFEKFEICRLTPTPNMSSTFDDFSLCIMAMKKPDSWDNTINYAFVDVLANMYYSGLTHELDFIAEAIVQDNLSSDEMQFLHLMIEYYEVNDFRKKLELLNSINTFNEKMTVIINYIRSLTYCVLGNKECAIKYYKKYFPYCKSYIAEAYGCFVYLYSGLDVNDDFRFKNLTRFVADEIIRNADSGGIRKFIYFKLRKDMVKKKLMGNIGYKPSSFLELKNLVLNLKERGKFTLKRLG
jgi:hypothetical protein